MIRYMIEHSFLNKHKMTPFRRFIKDALVRVTGNRFAQDLLEEIIQTVLVLQGFNGESDQVETSGERSVVNLVKSSGKSPYCIFDVGANQGQYLEMILANLATDSCSIHCFEPGVEPFGHLEKTHNQDARILLNNLAVGKEDGSATLYYDFAGSGSASLTRRQLDHRGISFDQSEPVTVATIDSYCSGNNIEHIHLLKIDVEGHELDVLHGAHRMFAAGGIDVVAFEFGACNVDTRTFFRDFWLFFTDVNMAIFRITPSGYLYPITTYSDVHEKHGGSNMVAVRRDL